MRRETHVPCDCERLRALADHWKREHDALQGLLRDERMSRDLSDSSGREASGMDPEGTPGKPGGGPGVPVLREIR